MLTCAPHAVLRRLARLAAGRDAAAFVAAELVALVAPPACALCRTPLRGGHETICMHCRRDLVWLPGDRCERCALPRRCDPCPARGAAFQRAWAPLAHDGAARAIVAALKFRGALALADLMAAQIAANAPLDLLEDATFVPVPAHPRRRRERGYDQAELLARALARRAQRPLSSCLVRRGPATRQLGAGRGVRRADGRIVVEALAPAPAIALLVDDVHTTGATLDACASVLLTAGASCVRCVTYARALPG